MPETYDLLIRNATVYDGSGAPGVHADVGVRGDRIARVGPTEDGQAGEEIDATGLALAPGFIDVHAHDDLLVLLNPDVEGKVDRFRHHHHRRQLRLRCRAVRGHARTMGCALRAGGHPGVVGLRRLSRRDRPLPYLPWNPRSTR
ncbi:MAG: hypothetical protein HYX51_05615 [Chloroflexi bacterium]|nr:hypothetical protein [Chloroflexota bacterium]